MPRTMARKLTGVWKTFVVEEGYIFGVHTFPVQTLGLGR